MQRPWRSSIGSRYVLGEQVGAGGMGVVHRAEQPALARTVAVKMLRAELASDPRINARFRAEALAVARLAHPNLVTVIDYGETSDGTPFVVMEYVRGRTLGAIIRDGAELTVDRVIRLVRQILAGLDAAHAAGVVHADVKSDNVLVERGHDGDDRIKLVDFGLARIGRGRGERFGGEVMGTPEYMAPEVIAGAEPTPAADLYGVGVILYELLTGALPFTGTSAEQVMQRHLEDLVVPPSVRRPDRGISAGLERVVTLALAKRPDERISNALAFSAALDAAPHEPADDDSCRPAMVGVETSTQPYRHQLPSATPNGVVGAGAPCEERGLRRNIGDAIASGRVDAIASGYVELARLLTQRGQIHSAIFELEEAVELVTAGRGPGPGDENGPTKPLVDALMTLYATLDERDEHFAGAAEGWRTLTETD